MLTAANKPAAHQPPKDFATWRKGEQLVTNEFEAARLEMNARFYRPDPTLDRAVSLFYEDREAWNRLPRQIRDQTGHYESFKRYYSDAVKAGVIKADRGPA